MKVYTVSEARQKLATLLEEACRQGEVRIKRRDGKMFSLKFQPSDRSPLDVRGLDLDISRDEIVEMVKEGRKYE